MTPVYEAIYEQGIFRPIAPPAALFTEGQTMRIVVETTPADDLLNLAAQVYEGLTDEQILAVERITLTVHLHSGTLRPAR